MRFRFRVLNPSNNIDPNSFSCGATFNPTALNIFGLTLYLNGTQIANYNQGTLDSGDTVTTGVGPLTATFSVENSTYLRVEINIPTRDDTADLRIKVTSTDHETFDTTFKIFGFDMGLNPNISYPLGMENYTKPIEIRLIPKNWLLPSPNTFHLVCASAYVYRDYTTGKIHILKNNSSIGTSSYRTPTGVVDLAVGDFVEIDNTDEGITSLIMTTTNGSLTSTTNLVVPSAPIGIPILGFSYNNPSCNSCLCLKQDTIVVLSLNVGAVESYLINDGLIDPTFPTLNYNIELINESTGAIVENNNFSNSPNPALAVITNNYTPGVDIDETIDYNIRYTIRSVNISGAIIAQDTFELEPCSKIELVKTDCNIYEWTNKTGVVTVTLKKMDGAGVLTTVETHTSVALNTVKTFTLDDGVYILQITQGELINFSYKLIAMCTYISCLAKYTEEVACADPCEDKDCGCEDCNDSSNRDIFTLLSFSYLALINKLNLENPLFTSLNTESSTTLQDLALIQDRMNKYCTGCS